MVVVIGATGFIGLYTVEKLIKEGYQVLGTGRNKVAGEILKNMGADFVDVDLKDTSSFAKIPTGNVEAVILLAGLLPANAPVDI